jgi:hypothetical protein
MADFTAKDILKQLDNCADDYVFPMLDNGYVYLANTQLKAYRDETRWVIIIEVVGYNYRDVGHGRIDNMLHIFGNCVNNIGIKGENFLFVTDDSEEGETFDEEGSFHLQPSIHSFLLRGQKHQICHDRNAYTSIGIELEDANSIKGFEFLRYLTRETPNSFWATEEEIRDRIPIDIPKIIELKEWFHPDLVNDEMPSKNETFKQLAKVLETGDIHFYKPTKLPNTHWKHWPVGGTL